MQQSVDIKVTGAEKLDRLGSAIKAAGDKEIGRKLSKAMTRSGARLRKSARAGAIAILPYRGGLAERVAASVFTARTRTIGKGAGVRITAKNRYSLGQMDRGIIRHKVYGKWRKNTPDQHVQPGWFTKPMLLDAPQERRDIIAAIDELAAELRAKG